MILGDLAKAISGCDPIFHALKGVAIKYPWDRNEKPGARGKAVPSEVLNHTSINDN